MADGALLPFPGSELHHPEPGPSEVPGWESWVGVTVDLTAAVPSVLCSNPSPERLRQAAQFLLDMADGMDCGDNPLEVAMAEWRRRARTPAPN